MRAFDMFCGGGGSSLGARMAGATIVGGADIDSFAGTTFRRNFPDAQLFPGDLCHLNMSSLSRALGKVDLLLSSPECTNHSCAKGNAPRSEESRNTALQVVRFAAELRPRWIILENVIHMRPWSRYGELQAELKQLDYSVKELVLDASMFGVPQKRKRLFVIADREREVGEIAFAERRTKSARTILDAKDTWKTSLLRIPGRATATLERAERGMKEVGRSEAFLLVYYGSDGAGGWQSLDVPLRTITTLDRFALVEPSPHGHTIRMLQPSELRRAMGFPASYEFGEGTRREKIRILGNAVCPPVMRAIVSAVCNDTRKSRGRGANGDTKAASANHKNHRRSTHKRSRSCTH